MTPLSLVRTVGIRPNLGGALPGVLRSTTATPSEVLVAEALPVQKLHHKALNTLFADPGIDP
jgi:hypothetical protein